MLKHYAEFYSPGSFFNETDIVPMDCRSVDEAINKAPKTAFAFTFFDREELEQVGEVLRGHSKNRSQRYYLGGDLLTVEQVKAQVPNSDILVNNMECNGWKQVIRTPFGNFQPLHEGDVVLQVKQP